MQRGPGLAAFVFFETYVTRAPAAPVHIKAPIISLSSFTRDPIGPRVPYSIIIAVTVARMRDSCAVVIY